MTKGAITRTWFAGLIGLAAGLVVAGVGVGLMLAYGGQFTPAPGGNGYDFVPTFDQFFWSMVGFIVLGGTIAIAGGIVQLVAWVGALINTNRLEDKTWFTILMLGGIVGFIFAPVGFAVMVAYVIAGPDGMTVQPTETLKPAVAPTTLPQAT